MVAGGVGEMRIFIGDDEATVRSALKLLLEQRPGVKLIGEARDAAELLSRLPRLAPDVILLDWELPGKGDGLLAELYRASPGARVIALSSLP